VSYGAEAWTLTKKEEQALLIFEGKVFRRIYGPKYENGEWKCRTNRELEEEQSFSREVNRRISPHFMEPEGLIPHSQEPAIHPFPEPVQSSP